MLGELWIEGDKLKIETDTGIKTMSPGGSRPKPETVSNGEIYFGLPFGNPTMTWVNNNLAYTTPCAKAGTTTEPDGSLWIVGAVLMVAHNGIRYEVQR